MNVPTRTRAYLAWTAMCLIWGTTYPAIRIALETMPPLMMAAIRWTSAGVLTIIVLKTRGARFPHARSWPSLAIIGVLLFGVGNGAVVWAEQTIPSGLTAVFVTTMPFWMIGVDAMLPDGERLTWRHLVGLSIGFSGMAALLWPEIRLGGAGRGLTGAIATQIACAGWAIGSAYARRRCWVDNLPENAALQMMFGGLGLLVVGLLRGEPAAFGVSGRSLGALAYLTLVGSIGGFLAYMYALKHLPISFVSLYSYVNPLIAFPLGALVLQEPLTWRTVASSAIVVAGVAVVRREQQRLAATSRTPAPPDNAAST